MSIRLKLVLVVLPILLVAVVLAGMSSQIVATRAVTRVATEFLDFKASELEKYAESQWNLLVENNVADRPDMVAAAQAGVESFARSLVRSDTEIILAIRADGTIASRTAAIDPTAEDMQGFAGLFKTGARGFQALTIAGVDRVSSGFAFGPFG